MEKAYKMLRFEFKQLLAVTALGGLFLFCKGSPFGHPWSRQPQWEASISETRSRMGLLGVQSEQCLG